jgi:signal transduction histidine kinase
MSRAKTPSPLGIAPVALFRLSVLALTYGLALAFFEPIRRASEPGAYFGETYLGCIGASAALSAIALALRPGMRLLALFFLRCYLILILGYSIEGFLSVKLVLGIGLVAEACLAIPHPLCLVLSGLATAAIAAAQAFPGAFGPTALASAPRAARADEIAAFAFALAFSAVASASIGRAAARRAELSDAIRVQEANLDALAEINMNLQGYARTVDEVSSERERNRISREIHDISGYIFTNLIALMDAAGSMRRDDQAGLSDILVTARAQAQEGLRETRAALRRLRSEKTEAMDSAQAIYRIVSIFRKIAGIRVELNLGNLPRPLAQDLSLALYRTVQEGLTNAIRHGKATFVRVSFWVAEGGEVRLNIADNGKGAFEVVKGIGLTGMDERIGALGGKVEIGRAPEGGFSLSIAVPLKLAEGSE